MNEIPSLPGNKNETIGTVPVFTALLKNLTVGAFTGRLPLGVLSPEKEQYLGETKRRVELAESLGYGQSSTQETESLSNVSGQLRDWSFLVESGRENTALYFPGNYRGTAGLVPLLMAIKEKLKIRKDGIEPAPVITWFTDQHNTQHFLICFGNLYDSGTISRLSEVIITLSVKSHLTLDSETQQKVTATFSNHLSNASAEYSKSAYTPTQSVIKYAMNTRKLRFDFTDSSSNIMASLERLEFLVKKEVIFPLITLARKFFQVATAMFVFDNKSQSATRVSLSVPPIKTTYLSKWDLHDSNTFESFFSFCDVSQIHNRSGKTQSDQHIKEEKIRGNIGNFDMQRITVQMAYLFRRSRLGEKSGLNKLKVLVGLSSSRTGFDIVSNSHDFIPEDMSKPYLREEVIIPYDLEGEDLLWFRDEMLLQQHSFRHHRWKNQTLEDISSRLEILDKEAKEISRLIDSAINAKREMVAELEWTKDEIGRTRFMLFGFIPFRTLDSISKTTLFPSLFSLPAKSKLKSLIDPFEVSHQERLLEEDQKIAEANAAIDDLKPERNELSDILGIHEGFRLLLDHLQLTREALHKLNSTVSSTQLVPSSSNTSEG